MRRDDMGEAIKLLQALGHQHADTDFFTFDVQLQREPALDAPNVALSATAYLGEREFERTNGGAEFALTALRPTCRPRSIWLALR